MRISDSAGLARDHAEAERSDADRSDAERSARAMRRVASRASEETLRTPFWEQLRSAAAYSTPERRKLTMRVFLLRTGMKTDRAFKRDDVDGIELDGDGALQ